VFEQEKGSSLEEDRFKYLQRRREVGVGLRREGNRGDKRRDIKEAKQCRGERGMEDKASTTLPG
jgi:hypothetical protein